MEGDLKTLTPGLWTITMDWVHGVSYGPVHGLPRWIPQQTTQKIEYNFNYELSNRSPKSTQFWVLRCTNVRLAFRLGRKLFHYTICHFFALAIYERLGSLWEASKFMPLSLHNFVQSVLPQVRELFFLNKQIKNFIGNVVKKNNKTKQKRRKRR